MARRRSQRGFGVVVGRRRSLRHVCTAVRVSWPLGTYGELFTPQLRSVSSLWEQAKQTRASRRGWPHVRPTRPDVGGCNHAELRRAAPRCDREPAQGGDLRAASPCALVEAVGETASGAGGESQMAVYRGRPARPPLARISRRSHASRCGRRGVHVWPRRLSLQPRRRVDAIATSRAEASPTVGRGSRGQHPASQGVASSRFYRRALPSRRYLKRREPAESTGGRAQCGRARVLFGRWRGRLHRRLC